MIRAPAALLVAALATGGAGCLRRDAAPPLERQRVEYTRRTFQSSLAGCTDPAGAPVPCVHLEVDYVEATRATTALAGAVSAFIAGTALGPVADGAPAASDVEALRDDLYELYRQTREQTPDYVARWTVERTVTVACNTERVQALVASERLVSGESVLERVEYRTFDNGSGAAVRLEDLFDDENLGRFVEEAARRAAAGPQAGRGGGLFERGETRTVEALGEPDGVLVCPDRLTLRWDGPLAREVAIPREEIATLLRADAP